MSKGKVLIMDDEEIVREVAGKMLEFLGYEADFAEEGVEAIEKYQIAKVSGNPYAAVIMDLSVPAGMGGQEAVKKLLEFDSDAKAVVSSGYANDPIVAEYADYGFSAAIGKPYELKELGDTLERVVSEVEH